MLTERLDEGLLVLQHMLHWDLVDVTYMVLNETKEGKRRWDGQPFVDRPQFDDLPQKVRNKDVVDLAPLPVSHATTRKTILFGRILSIIGRSPVVGEVVGVIPNAARRHPFPA